MLFAPCETGVCMCVCVFVCVCVFLLRPPAMLMTYFLQGQEWVDHVRRCLMTLLLNTYANVPPSLAHNRARSCDLITAAAFRSHDTCYVGNGYCRVIRHCRNIQASFETAEIRDLIPFVSPFYWQISAQASLHTSLGHV